MKIAISSNSGNPDQPFSSRFGRCSCFLITETDSGSWEEVSNSAADAAGGAGTQVVRLLADQGVEAVISGSYGPNAYEALRLAGIGAYLAGSGTPNELIAQYQAGSLSQTSGPTRGGQHQGGGGRGRGGRGRGGRW